MSAELERRPPSCNQTLDVADNTTLRRDVRSTEGTKPWNVFTFTEITTMEEKYSRVYLFPVGLRANFEERYVKIKYEIISDNNYTRNAQRNIAIAKKESPTYRVAIMDFRLAHRRPSILSHVYV